MTPFSLVYLYRIFFNKVAASSVEEIYADISEEFLHKKCTQLQGIMSQKTVICNRWHWLHICVDYIRGPEHGLQTLAMFG
jgi:hypothetical protein